MRALLLVALISSAAHAEELSETQKLVLGGVAGGALVTYGLVSTMLMMDDLINRGYSEPSRTAPAGALAAAALISSVGSLVGWGLSRDEVGVVGGAIGATMSLGLCFFVALSVHGWLIHNQRPGD